MIRQGKVRYIGASNFSAERLQQSPGASKGNLPLYLSFQPKYNLYDRGKFEDEYQQLCIREDVGVICYFGLASGFLTGKYRSAADFGKSQRGGNMQKYLNDRGHAILPALDDVSQRNHTTQAAVALAWLIAQPGITAPISSATSVHQLHELLQCVTLNLSQEDLTQLTKASDVHAAAN